MCFPINDILGSDVNQHHSRVLYAFQHVLHVFCQLERIQFLPLLRHDEFPEIYGAWSTPRDDVRKDVAVAERVEDLVRIWIDWNVVGLFQLDTPVSRVIYEVDKGGLLLFCIAVHVLTAILSDFRRHT